MVELAAPHSITSSAEQLVGHSDAEHPCRAGVDDQLKLGRLNNRQVSGLSTLENTAGIDANLTIRVPDVGSIAHQSADFGVFTHIMRRRQPVERSQLRQLDEPDVEERGGCHEQFR
jgi:hypothetical protein